MISKLKISVFGRISAIPSNNRNDVTYNLIIELYTRLLAKGHDVIIYGKYNSKIENGLSNKFEGLPLKCYKTNSSWLYDSFIYSFKATFDIIISNRSGIVHILGGSYSFWAFFLRLSGKKVFISQFAIESKSSAEPLYVRLLYLICNYMTVTFSNQVLFDNIQTQNFFINKYKNLRFSCIPLGFEIKEPSRDNLILSKLGIVSGKFFLLLGNNSITDKNNELIINAYRALECNLKLVIINELLNRSFEVCVFKKSEINRIVIQEFLEIEEVNFLIKHAYAFIQSSSKNERLQILNTVIGLGTPVVCCDSIENICITNKHATFFKSGETASVSYALNYTITNYDKILVQAKKGEESLIKRYNWDTITNKFVSVFSK